MLNFLVAVETSPRSLGEHDRGVPSEATLLPRVRIPGPHAARRAGGGPQRPGGGHRQETLVPAAERSRLLSPELCQFIVTV